MSIVIELLHQLKAVAAEHGVDRVEAFTVQAGALRGIVPEALDIAFESASEGTVAEGAELTLEILPPKAKCRQCGNKFEPGIDTFYCRVCNHADVDIIGGNEIMLTSVTGQQEKEESETDED